MVRRQNYMTEPTSEIAGINRPAVKSLSVRVLLTFYQALVPLNSELGTSQIYVIVRLLCSTYCAITHLVKIELQHCHCRTASLANDRNLGNIAVKVFLSGFLMIF